MNIYEKELKHNGINSEKYGSAYKKELEHYGVLGMKWGVRRYQNADGSLTDAGRKRYGSENRKTNNPHGTWLDYIKTNHKQ